LPADEPTGPAVPGDEKRPDGPGLGAGTDGPRSGGIPGGHKPGGIPGGHGAGGIPGAAPGNGADPGPAPGPDNGAAPDKAAGHGLPSGPGNTPPAGVRIPVRAGRNLPAALGVGLALGALALLTLFTVKATFLVYVAAAVGIALWELSRAFAARQIRLPLAPVAVGGAAALPLAYWYGERALVACMAVTVIVILAWRLPGGSVGYLRDVTAGVLALVYLPLMACFVALMLAAPGGARRTLVFLILTVCSDVGGYAAGILLGRHPMAPTISPKKTWEGFAGSGVACVVAGGITLPTLLHGAVWQGVLLGVAALATATLGDLAESMIKRDLEIKDMGTVLPGHGGILDRIDSLLVTAPVVWLLLLVFVPVSGAA
jgi:phosphatidate cytidylyltransferase